MQADPLAQLKPLHLPADPSWWPPAPGWWLLLLILLALLLFAGRRLSRWRTQRIPLRYAQSQHRQLVAALNAGTMTPERYLTEANGLLKRLVIHRHGDRASASVTAHQWLEYLVTVDPKLKAPASVSQWLERRRYQSSIRAFGVQERTEIVEWFERALTSLAGHTPPAVRPPAVQQSSAAP